MPPVLSAAALFGHRLNKPKEGQMRFLVKHRPSPAMVVACIALSVALGGTSYAAIKLPQNSVGAKQLKKSAVTSPKVKNNALTGADVNEATLGRVPSATSATTAANAATATIAANAGNANTLESIPASGFLRSTNEGGGALAGANVNSNATLNASFNRFGGAPTVTRLALGQFKITFPGLEGKLLNSKAIHIATLAGVSGEIATFSSGGNPFVQTFDSSGAAADKGFYYTVYGTNLAP